MNTVPNSQAARLAEIIRDEIFRAQVTIGGARAALADVDDKLDGMRTGLAALRDQLESDR